MPVAVAIGAAAVVGGIATSSAAKSAANSSQKATDASIQNNRETIEAQREQQERAIQTARENTELAYNRVTGLQDASIGDIEREQRIASDKNYALWGDFRDSLQPYLSAGTSAINRISTPQAVNENFAVSPDYNFRLKEGLNAVNTNRAVNGMLKSGSALKAISNYGQNTAANEFANWWARQKGLVDVGMNALGNDRIGVAGQTDATKSYADTMSNAFNAVATAKGNAANNAGTVVTGVASNTANAMMNALSSANKDTNDALMQNAATQGNAAMTQANALNGTLGSITGLLAKYGGTNTGSSYTKDAGTTTRAYA